MINKNKLIMIHEINEQNKIIMNKQIINKRSLIVKKKVLVTIQTSKP